MEVQTKLDKCDFGHLCKKDKTDLFIVLYEVVSLMGISVEI